MPTFLDPDDDIELDMGMFDEDPDDVAIDMTTKAEMAEEKDIKKIATVIQPETVDVEVDGAVVNTETGEILAEGPEAGLPVELPDDDAEDVLENMNNLGLTVEKTLAPPIIMEEAEENIKLALDTVSPKAPESPVAASEPAEVFSDFNTPPDKVEVPEAVDNHAPAPKPCPTNAIQKAISLMEYHHVKELDPDVQFKDCDFGVFAPEIAEAQKIVDMYYDEGFEANLGRMEWDLGRLSAIMVRLHRAVGFFQGSGEQIEKFRKAAEAGCYVELKELRDEHNLRVSDKDADKTSRMLAAKYTKKHVKDEILAKMITNFWFSTRKFIDVMEGIVVRNRSGAKTEEHTEAAARKQDPDENVTTYQDHAKPAPREEAVETGDTLGF